MLFRSAKAGENGLRCFLDPRRVGAVVCCPRRVSLCRMQLSEARVGYRCDGTLALSDGAGSVGLYGAWAQQQSRYPGIRGCPQKPIVAITTQPIGQVLEFYSCTGGSKVFLKRARYIPLPRIEKGGIDLCEKLHRAIVYYTAYLVALSTGQTDLAASMSNIANELMK